MRIDIRKEELEALRERYPQGCRVELVKMDDPYREMPPGLHGTVTGVDDTGSIHIHWDNGSSLAVVYKEDECRKLYGKEEVDVLFEKIVGCRFESYGDMEQWFGMKLGDTPPKLNIVKCDGINAEIENGMTEVDYSTDCTFGEKIFGMEYADFTINYILDNGKRMYVTYARWN